MQVQHAYPIIKNADWGPLWCSTGNLYVMCKYSLETGHANDVFEMVAVAQHKGNLAVKLWPCKGSIGEEERLVRGV